jgi:hypothetical protein
MAFFDAYRLVDRLDSTGPVDALTARVKASTLLFCGFATVLITANCGQDDSLTGGGADGAADNGFADVRADQGPDATREVGSDKTPDASGGSTADGNEAQVGDFENTTVTDGRPDERYRDISLCTQDATTIVCCCDGDLGGTVVCNSDGTLSCSGGGFFPDNTFGLYYGADCSRACGPCSLPCPDSEPHETGADASEGASD